jgi:DNA-binding XRE family transcriptional regulator
MTTGRDTETFLAGDERVRRLREKPGLVEDVASAREEMREADRVYAMGLAALRRAADLTQTELARSLGVSQAAIAKTEQRHDLLLSTLNTYLAALAGTCASSSPSTVAAKSNLISVTLTRSHQRAGKSLPDTRL